MNEIKQKIVQVFNQIAGFEKYLEDNYYLIGSAALVLAGVKVDSISDIDILTSKRDAHTLKNLWKSKLETNHQFKDESLFRSNFARFEFDEIAIEVMGDLEICINNHWERLKINEFIEIKLDKYSIKIPILKEQKRILALFGREKDLRRIELIDKFIDKK